MISGLFAGRDVRRSAVHHVLEHVRQPALAWGLVSRPHVILEVDRHDRRRVILVHHDGQPVRQNELRVGDFRDVERRCRTGLGGNLHAGFGVSLRPDRSGRGERCERDEQYRQHPSADELLRS